MNTQPRKMYEAIDGFGGEPMSEFAKLKWAIGGIMFHKLKMSESGNAIEANPATHAIAEFVHGKIEALHQHLSDTLELLEAANEVIGSESILVTQRNARLFQAYQSARKAFKEKYPPRSQP